MCWYDPIPDQLRNAPVLESMAYDSRMSKKPWKTKISLVEWNGQRDGTVFQALFSCGADHIPYSRLFLTVKYFIRKILGYIKFSMRLDRVENKSTKIWTKPKNNNTVHFPRPVAGHGRAEEMSIKKYSKRCALKLCCRMSQWKPVENSYCVHVVLLLDNSHSIAVFSIVDSRTQARFSPILGFHLSL